MLRRLRALLPFDRYMVEGESMLPAYASGQRLLVSRFAYWFGSPKVGDIVVLRDPRAPMDLMLKRISFVHENSYEVTGDNPEASTDSRTFGPVTGDLIVGKVWFSY